jgi:hypothetical protein
LESESEPRVIPDLDKVRRDLAAASIELDDRLNKAIEGNSLSIWIRYGILIALSLIVVSGIAVAVATAEHVAGGIAVAVPLPLIGWLLNNLKGLQDERIRLQVRVARYMPRIVTCGNLECLQQVATEIARDLDILNGTPVAP